LGKGRLVIEVSISHTGTPHAHTHTYNPLYKRSARRRGRYLNNTPQKQETNIHKPSSEFEPTVPATKRPQTYALDRTASRMALLPHY